MFEKENHYYRGGYPLSSYRHNMASPPLGYNNTGGDRSNSAGGGGLSAPPYVLASSLAHGTTLDSLEEMLHVGSDRLRHGSRRASPQRGTTTTATSHYDPVPAPLSYRSTPVPAFVPSVEHRPSHPRMSSVAHTPPPAATPRLAADLYVVQLEQEVEALTLDCERAGERFCAVSAAYEQRVLLSDEMTSRGALEHAEQHAFVGLWSLFSATLKLRREAHWAERVRAAEWKATAAEETVRAITASKADLERQVQRLEQQLVQSAAASTSVTTAVEALFRTEHNKLASLLEQVPARVRTEMAAADTPASTPAPVAVPPDPALRALVESIAEQLRQRPAVVEPSPAAPAVVPVASPASVPVTGPASTSSAQFAQLIKCATASMERVSDEFLRASEGKMRYAEYEMQVAQLVANKQTSLTWAARHEELRIENRRLQENILSLRTQLKVSLNQDATPSASLVFNTYGAGHEKRARLYAQYASPFIPPSLELTAAPAKRSAEDLRSDALRLGARPAEVPPIPSPSRNGSPEKQSTTTAAADGAAPSWRFGTNTGPTAKPVVDRTHVSAALSGTFSLQSPQPDTPLSEADRSHSSVPAEGPSPKRLEATASSSSASPSPASAVRAAAVVKPVGASAPSAGTHEDNTTAVSTTRNGSLSGVPQVKRFAFKAASRSASSSSSLDTSASIDTEDRAQKQAKPAPKVRPAKPAPVSPDPSSTSSSSSDSEPAPVAKKQDKRPSRSASPAKAAGPAKAAPKAATPSVVGKPKTQRKRTSMDSSASDTDSSTTTLTDDSSDDDVSHHVANTSAMPPKASTTAAPATGLKSLMPRLSAASSVNASFNGTKSELAAGTNKKATSRSNSSKPTPKAAAKAAQKTAVSHERHNSFDEEDGNEDAKPRRSLSNSSYTYSYTASSAPAPKPSATPAAASTQAKTAKPAAHVRRSSFDDDEDEKAVKPAPKTASKDAKAAPKPAAATKSVTASPATGSAPARAQPVSVTPSAASSPKSGGLKLPSW